MSKSGSADREFTLFLRRFDVPKLERMRDAILGEQRTAIEAEISRRRNSLVPPDELAA